MAGRKSRYDTHIEPRLEEIKLWCRDGNTDAEICEKLGVAVSTFYKWKGEKTELAEALKENKIIADKKVEDSLFKMACGYEYEETHTEQKKLDEKTGAMVKKITKQVPPNVTAIIFWLKNRQPDKWRDKQEVDLSGDLTVVFGGRKDGTV